MNEEKDNKNADGLANTKTEKEPQAEDVQERKTLKTFIFTIILLLLVVSAAAYILVSRNSQDTENGNQLQAKAYLENDRPIACVFLGYQTIQCENLEDGSIVKYKTPEYFKNVNSVIPNDDASQFIISYQKVNDYDIGVYDTSFTKIRDLKHTSYPGESEKFSYKEYNYRWLMGSTTLAVTESIIYDDWKLNQYKVSMLKSDGEEKIVPISLDEHFFIFGGDEENLYAWSSEDYDLADEQEKPNNLFVIDVQSGEMSVIDTEDVDYEEGTQIVGPNASYEYLGNDMFLIHARSIASAVEEQRLFIISQLVEKDGTLKLERRERKDISVDDSWNFGTVVRSIKGVKTLNNDSSPYDYSASFETYPFTFTDSSWATTPSKLAGGRGVMFTLKDWPDLVAEATSEPETTDFVTYPDGTPDVIVNEALTMVKEDDECGHPNNKPVIDIQTFDGEDQFSAHISNCQKDAWYVFKVIESSKTEGGQYRYEEVFASQEGIGCSERDRMGISATTVPECRADNSDGL